MKEHSERDIHNQIQNALNTPVDRRRVLKVAGAAAAGIIMSRVLLPEDTGYAQEAFEEAVHLSQLPYHEAARIIDQQYAQFRAIAESDEYTPDQIPQHTLMRYFGLNVLGGDNPDLKADDIQRLPTKSILHIGTEPDLMDRLQHIEADKRPRIIHRYYTSPANTLDWNTFRHTVHVAKEYHFHGKHPDEIVEKEKPRITFLTEPSLYNSRWHRDEFGQPELSPEDVAQTFMEGATFIRDNNCIPLLPAMAPHTPGFEDKFRFGDEIQFYERFLHAVASHDDFEMIGPTLEIDLHAYTRHPGEDIWERIGNLDSMIQKMLGRRFPVHFTEFGLAAPLTSMDPVTRALEVRRVLRSPIPDDTFPIASLNWWTLFKLPPKEVQKPGGPLVEDYSRQSLRVSDRLTGLDYRAIEYTHQERIRDIQRYHEFHGIAQPEEVEATNVPNF